MPPLKVWYSCLGCGISVIGARRCPKCAPPERNPAGHWSLNRNRLAQARFRRAVLARFEGQCAAVVDGERCPVTTDLQAHHTKPGNDDPGTGVALCRIHHRMLDSFAR
jgi:predicted restriction endonuclease